MVAPDAALPLGSPTSVMENTEIEILVSSQELYSVMVRDSPASVESVIALPSRRQHRRFPSLQGTSSSGRSNKIALRRHPSTSHNRTADLYRARSPIPERRRPLRHGERGRSVGGDNPHKQPSQRLLVLEEDDDDDDDDSEETEKTPDEAPETRQEVTQLVSELTDDGSCDPCIDTSKQRRALSPPPPPSKVTSPKPPAAALYKKRVVQTWRASPNSSKRSSRKSLLPKKV